MQRLALVCGTALLLLLSQGLAEETDRTVTVVGKSAQNYTEAIEIALRDAVRQAGGVFLESQTEVRDFELKSDSIYSRSRGYVRSYQVTAKKRGLNDTYVAEVEATVSVAEIKDDWAGLAMLSERKGRPDLAIACKPDKSVGTTQTACETVESLLADFFDKYNLDIKDSETLETVLGEQQARAELWDDHKKASALALKVRVPYIVLAKLRLPKPKEDKGGFVEGFRAEANLRVKLVARDASLLASKQAFAKVGDDSPESAADGAVKKAVAELAPKVLDRLVYHWARDLDRGRKIAIELTAVPERVIQSLVNELKNARDEYVRVIGLSEDVIDAKGVSVLQVWGESVTPSWIAGRIDQFKGAKLKVVRRTRGKVECESVGYKGLKQEVEKRLEKEAPEPKPGANAAPVEEEKQEGGNLAKTIGIGSGGVVLLGVVGYLVKRLAGG